MFTCVGQLDFYRAGAAVYAFLYVIANVQDTDQQINQLSLQIIQLQAQGNMLASDFQDATVRFVDKKREIQTAIDKLRKQIAVLQKQAKAKDVKPPE